MWYPKVRVIPFEGESEAPLPRRCDVRDCPCDGAYKAPKSRYNLRDYYWFCLDHVREYNKNWDYFKGMSQGEIENHMYKSMVWDRPTWRSTLAGMKEAQIHQAVYDEFRTGGDGARDFGINDDTEARVSSRHIPRPVLDALAVMDLSPPLDWAEVRARYKSLAKKYHPDINQGDPAAEDRLKKINIAYSILKLAHEAFIQMENET